ncbi:MAG: PilZ domain-containing protein [Acidobacteria bacterium]|nr:PilZ domain-containing protein [Acidobacteriota bacterium]
MSMHPIRAGEWSGPEQRRHKRVPLGVPVECQAGRGTIQGKAENISTSGLLIRAAKTFSEDEEVTLRFSLPGSKPVIQCQARVSHVVLDIFMGVEFLELPPEAALLVEKYVAAAPNESRGRS